VISGLQPPELAMNTVKHGNVYLNL